MGAPFPAESRVVRRWGADAGTLPCCKAVHGCACAGQHSSNTTSVFPCRWLHEHPLHANDGFAAEGASLKRHLMARCGAVAIVSSSTWRWWEAWALHGAHQSGLDYSPLVGRQESFGSQPRLPPSLPNLRVVRNPLPSWIVPLLELGDGSSAAPMTECSRDSQQWPLASLRQHFRQQIGATDEGERRSSSGCNVWRYCTHGI